MLEDSYNRRGPRDPPLAAGKAAAA